LIDLFKIHFYKVNTTLFLIRDLSTDGFLTGIGEMNLTNIEHSLQFSNTDTTRGFQRNVYFTMWWYMYLPH